MKGLAGLLRRMRNPRLASASTGQASQSRHRYESLDLWRGVACLIVIVFHATLYGVEAHVRGPWQQLEFAERVLATTARLWIGVPLFFVISGYCIAASVSSATTKGTSVQSYFWRRFRRIFPPYWVALASTALAVWGLSVGGFSSLVHDQVNPMTAFDAMWGTRWLSNVLSVEGARYPLTHVRPAWLLGPAWTLGYEEQFYAVMGIALALGRSRWPSMVVAVTGLTLVTSALGYSGDLSGVFLDGRWLIFASGVWVHQALRDRRAFLPGAIALVAAIAWASRSPTRLLAEAANFEQELAVGCAFALILWRLHRWDLQIAGSFLLAPLTWCGTMCYSVYLVHWPLTKLISSVAFKTGAATPTATVVVVIPLCILVSLAVATVFHKTVERHFIGAPSVTGSHAICHS